MEEMKKMLMTKELSLLSTILKVDEKLLIQVRSVLDVKKVRRILIEREFQDAVKEGKFQKKQIISALMIKYDISKSGIEHIIYATVSNKEKFCTRCGTGISKYKWTRSKGVCDNCIAKEINQPKNEKA